MPGLLFHERPALRRPYLVMGFEGWADAGRVSSGAISQLRERLEVRRLAELRADDFYLFQSPGAEARRPATHVEGGLVKALSMPLTEFWFHINESSAHDLVIALGPEPELRWNEYAGVIREFALAAGVEKFLTIGGTYDSVPHTAAPVITAVLSDESWRAEMSEHGIGSTEYEGPTCIHTLLVVAAGKRGLRAATLWGHVPYYVQVPNPKVCYGILSRLTRMVDITLDLEDLRKAGEYLDHEVSSAIKKKPELESYVSGLEEEFSKGEQGPGEPPAEDIIRDVEDFLRNEKDE